MKPTFFDAGEQFNSDLFAMRNRLSEARQILDSLERSRERLAAENDRLRAERDALQVFTEAEAAERLRLEPTTLAAHRRNHRLPHLATGKGVRYTAQHIREIIALFEVNRTQKASVKKAA